MQEAGVIQMKWVGDIGGKKYSSRSGSAGDLEWRKLEERREEMKVVVFGKILEVLEEGRLAKKW